MSLGLSKDQNRKVQSGQKDSEGFVPWGARLCTHTAENPACCSPRSTGWHWKCSQIQVTAGPQKQLCTLQREQGGWGDRSSTVATWAPRQLFVRAQPVALGKAGKPRCCLCPIEAGCLQPLHLCSPPSPLLSSFTSLKAQLVILIIKP